MRAMRVVGKNRAAGRGALAFDRPVIRSLQAGIGDDFAERGNLFPDAGFFDAAISSRSSPKVTAAMASL